MYHRFSESADTGKVPTDTFHRQLAEITKAFHVLGLADLIRALRAERDLPPNTVVITIDDGYRDFYTVAYPILREFRVPATVFVSTDFVDGLNWLWPDVVAYTLDNCSQRPAAICRALGVAVQEAVSREVAWSLLADHCLSVPDEERRRLISQLLEVSGIGRLPAVIPREYDHMTWDELREIHANGITIGGHTRSHPNLAKVSPAKLGDEILGCKTRIEQKIGCPVECFCYPNGTPDDYNDAVKSIVVASGYIGAVVGFYDAEIITDPYEIRRFGASENMHQFRKALYGVEYCGARIAAIGQSGPENA